MNSKVTESIEDLRGALVSARENARINRSIIDAISGIYAVLYEINLNTNTYLELRTVPHVKRFVEQYSGADQCIQSVSHRLFNEADWAAFPQFADIHEWPQLLDDTNSFAIDVRDTRDRWCRITLIAAERDESGVPTIVLWAGQDIDSKKREEENYQATLQSALEAAQHANKAKTDFLNNVSHDIRTPMNAIVGYTSLAMTHIDNQDQVKNYLGKIITSSNHLLALINDVLDMSRIESGKVQISKAENSLPSIMRDLRNILQADIAAKELDFFLDSFDVRDENVICDRLRLSQVLLNITTNSVKYTPQGGSVSVRLMQEHGAPEGYADYVFTIKDTGDGMSEEFLQHIFEPFARAKSSTLSGVQGTGLGMAITKNLIDMMNGQIEIESELGRGTTTTLKFRFEKCAEQPKIHPIAELVDMRALVVDDDMNVCESVTVMLGEIGLRPDWTSSGREALVRSRMAASAGDPFHAFIIDWLMPDMSGVELVRRLRNEIDKDIPIIVLTAYDWSDIEEEAREAGVTAFCAKPLFASELFDVLRRHVEPEKDYEEVIVPMRDYAGTKIMLVEDNEINREIAVEILEEEGFVVECAVNGKVAVEQFNASVPGSIKMVLMDLQMPVMDGYESTRHIRSLNRPDAHSVPIVALTANAFNEDSQLAYDAGMDDYMTKPFHIEDLNALLRKHLG